MAALASLLFRRVACLLLRRPPSVSLAIFPLQITLWDLRLNDSSLALLESLYSYYFPVRLTDLAIDKLCIQILMEERQVVARFVVGSFILQSRLTHRCDWDDGRRRNALYMALQNKHRLADSLTVMLDEELAASAQTFSVSSFGAFFDWFVRGLRLRVAYFELRVEDSLEGLSFGIVAEDFETRSGEATPETLCTVPHACEASFFGVFVNPSATASENKNYLFKVHTAVSSFELPDLFSTMFQYGETPQGRGKRVLFAAHVLDAEMCFHDKQMQAFLYKALRFFGCSEWWEWKDEGAQRVADAEKKLTPADFEAMLLLYRDVYREYIGRSEAPVTTSPVAPSNGFDRVWGLVREWMQPEPRLSASRVEYLFDRLLDLELSLSLGDIMSLRRRALGWHFHSIDCPMDSRLTRFSLDDPQNTRMARHVSDRRLLHDRRTSYVSTFVFRCAMDGFRAFFFTNTLSNSSLERLRDYCGTQRFVFSAAKAGFSLLYRIEPAEIEAESAKLDVSMGFTRLKLVDVAEIIPGSASCSRQSDWTRLYPAFLLETDKDPPTDSDWNLYAQYGYPGIGRGCICLKANSVVLPLACAQQIRVFFSTMIGSLVRPSGAQSRGTALSNELYLGGRSISIELDFTSVQFALSSGDDIVLLELYGSLSAVSACVSESINARLRQALVTRTSSAAESRRLARQTLLKIQDSVVAISSTAAERCIGETELSWVEVDLIDSIRNEGLLRIDIAVISIRLLRAVLDRIHSDELILCLKVDGDNELSESHPINLVSTDEGPSYELLVPSRSEVYTVQLILTTHDGSEIGSSSFPIGSKIHSCSLTVFHESENIGKLEIRGDVGLPLLKLSIKGLKMYRQPLYYHEGKQHLESMHFIVQAPLPPDCSNTLTLSSSSFPSDIEIILSERFLFPCRPGVYFPITLILFLEGVDSDTKIASSSSILFNGNSINNTAVLRYDEMDVAEICFDFEWYSAVALEVDTDISTALEQEPIDELPSVEGKLPAEQTMAGNVSRRLKRVLDVNFDRLELNASSEDIIFVASALTEHFSVQSSPSTEACTLPVSVSDSRTQKETPEMILIEGPITPLCKDFTWESSSMRAALGKHSSLAALLSDSAPGIPLDSIWNSLNGYDCAVQDIDLGSIEYSAVVDLQITMVKCFQNYFFAKSVWGLVIVPSYLQLPRVGNISAKSGKPYFQMESPVGMGTFVFNDVNTIITSMDPWLRAQSLTGIMTSKGDFHFRGSKFLKFELSAPAVVYICWDMRYKMKPKWLQKIGFKKSGVVLQTSVSSHIMYYRFYTHNLNVVLGGCAMSQSNFDNYIVLIGPKLTTMKQPPAGAFRNLHWALRPSSALTIDTFLRPKPSPQVQPVEMATRLSNRLDVISITMHGNYLSCNLYNENKSALRFKAFVESVFVDMSIIQNNSTGRIVPSRQDGVSFTATSKLSIVTERKTKPTYLMEPILCRIAWSKISGDLNHSIEASTDTIVLNLFPELLTTLSDSVDDFKKVLNYLKGVQDKKSPIKNMFTRSTSTLISTRSSDRREFSRDNTNLTLYNDLGVDLRLWISGAGFDDSIEAGTPQEGYGLYSEDDELNMSTYCHQTLVLADCSVSVDFTDPLAPTLSADECARDFLSDVRFDCEIEGWDNVLQVQVSRKGVSLHPIFHMEERPTKSAQASPLPTRLWKSLSNSQLNELHASPIALWRNRNADSIKRMHSRAASETSNYEHSANDLFFADYLREVHTPYALRIDCKSYESEGGICEIRVSLTSNVKFQNNSGATLNMLHREAINFGDKVIPIENGKHWYLPLQCMEEQCIRFVPDVSCGVFETVVVPINKEMLDASIPQSLRRSFESDSLSIRVFPEFETTHSGGESGEPVGDANGIAIAGDPVVWCFEISPAITICNATASAIEVQVMQPPRATPTVSASDYSDARSIFFLPDEYYTRSGEGTDWDVDLLPEEEEGFMPDFKDDHLMICRAVVLPGDDVVVPYIQTDRTLYYRVRFPNSPDWSITHSIDKRLYGLKARVDKHKAEPVLWSSAALFPSVFMKKMWNDSYPSRRIEFFCTFIIVNKTGMLLRYINSAGVVDNADEIETSDNQQLRAFGCLDVPVMLDCPSNVLRVLPYAMHSGINSDLFYVFWHDTPHQSKSLCMTVTGLLPNTKVYYDAEDAVSTWPSIFEKFKSPSKSIVVQTSIHDFTSAPSESSFISFKVSSDSYINICFDALAPHLPAWMDELGFRSVGERVKTQSSTYQIYRKQYRAFSAVRLGGSKVKVSNQMFHQSTYSRMYFIVVVRCCGTLEPCVSPIRPSSSSSMSFHQLPNFRNGDQLFVDSPSETAVDIPTNISSNFLLLLQTFQSQRFFGKSLEFMLEQDSIVCICIDCLISVSNISWIVKLGFQFTSSTLQGSNTSYHIYSQRFKAGMISLGGLCLSNSSYHNYFVLVYCDKGQKSAENESVHETCPSLPPSRQFWNPVHGDVVLSEPDFDYCGRSWSREFNLTASNKGEVVASGCALSVRVQSLIGVFHRCRAITILPRFVVINTLGFDVSLFPYTSENPEYSPNFDDSIRTRYQLVKSQASAVLYVFQSISSTGEGHPYICVNAEPYLSATMNSRPICVNMVGEQYVWLALSDKSQPRIVSAMVRSQGTVFSITLSEDSSRHPFRLENRSKTALSFRQLGSNSDWDALPSLSWKSFLWTKPFLAEKSLEIRLTNAINSVLIVQLNKVGNVGKLIWNASEKYNTPTNAPTKGVLGFEVVVDVSTRVLKIFEENDFSLDTSHFGYDASPVSSIRTKQSLLKMMENGNVRIMCGGIYIRVLDDVGILGVSMERINLTIFGDKSTAEFSIFHVQVDDLNPTAKFPVIFLPFSSGRNSHLQPSRVGHISFVKMSSEWVPSHESVLQIKCFDLCVNELSLKISMDLIILLVSALGRTASLWTKAFQDTISVRATEMQAVNTVLNMSISDRFFNHKSSLENFYVYAKQLHHSKVVIHLEMFVGSRLSHINFNLMDKSIATGFAVLGGPLVAFLSSVVGSIAHVSPVFVFEEFLLRDYLGPVQAFVHIIYTVWNQQAFAQAYKIFGSLELIGNPLSFIDNISTGMSDFYSRTREEVQGTSSTRGEGVKRLARSVIAGTFGTASRVVGSLADVSRVISGSKGAVQYREFASPENVTQGLQQGGGVLISGVAKGITGLVNEPLRGMENDGLIGGVKGLGKGVIRLFAAPVTGTLDAVSILATSIEKGTQSIDGKPVGRIVREPKSFQCEI